MSWGQMNCDITVRAREQENKHLRAVVDGYEKAFREIRKELGLSEHDEHELVVDTIKRLVEGVNAEIERLHAEHRQGIIERDRLETRYLKLADAARRFRDGEELTASGLRDAIEEMGDE